MSVESKTMNSAEVLEVIKRSAKLQKVGMKFL